MRCSTNLPIGVRRNFHNFFYIVWAGSPETEPVITATKTFGFLKKINYKNRIDKSSVLFEKSASSHWLSSTVLFKPRVTHNYQARF